MNPLAARLAALGLLAVTLALFLLPGGATPAPSMPGMDKVAHVALFAALAFLTRLSFSQVSAWRVFVLLFAYGLLVELAQAYVPGRSPEMLDLLADVAGAGAGLAVARAWATRADAQPRT